VVQYYRKGGVSVVRILAACVLFVLTSSAEAADVDWKVYGGVDWKKFGSSFSGQSFCFYDAKTVMHTSSGYVRVWIKCVAEKDLIAVDLKSAAGAKIMSAAAEQLVKGYVPPIIAIGKLEFEQMDVIAVYEQIADSGIESQADVLEEMNCSERMMRQLRISARINGRSQVERTVGAWDYVSPEGNAATLLRLLCPRR